jgi:hypothetical protein
VRSPNWCGKGSEPALRNLRAQMSDRHYRRPARRWRMPTSSATLNQRNPGLQEHVRRGLWRLCGAAHRRRDLARCSAGPMRRAQPPVNRVASHAYHARPFPFWRSQVDSDAAPSWDGVAQRRSQATDSGRDVSLRQRGNAGNAGNRIVRKGAPAGFDSEVSRRRSANTW